MNKPLLLLQLDSFPKDLFHVVRFSGEEALSRLSLFEVLLVSDAEHIDLEKILQARAQLHVRREESVLLFSGLVQSAEYLHQSGRFRYYRLELAPVLQRLDLMQGSSVYLDCSLEELVATVLSDAGLKQNSDFSLQFEQNYEVREMVCRFNESAFAFVARRLEENGAVFYFDPQSGREHCVITDASIFQEIPGGPLDYLPESGMDAGARVIHRFGKRLQSGPGKVLVSDCNYRLASYSLSASQVVRGCEQQPHPAELQVFAPDVKSDKQCRRLARTMSSRLAYAREHFTGSGVCASFHPGRTFTLRGHDNNAYNQKYLLTRVRHQGHQEGYLARMLGLPHPKGKAVQDKALYENSYEACPHGAPYLPARHIQRPSIHGLLSARIDGSGSGEYAEMDDQGRYKVILPFDLSGRKDGKASAWIRMNQPYAGLGHGMHLPLRKGCEVALLFLDGNPDRPVIAGALPNPSNASPVADYNGTRNVLATAHGNALQLEDKKDAAGLLLENRGGKHFLRLGHPVSVSRKSNDTGNDGGDGGATRDDAAAGGAKADHSFGTFLKQQFGFASDSNDKTGTYGMEVKAFFLDCLSGSKLETFLGEQSKTNLLEQFSFSYGPMDYSWGKLAKVRVLLECLAIMPGLASPVFHLLDFEKLKPVPALKELSNVAATSIAAVMPAKLLFDVALSSTIQLLPDKDWKKAENRIFTLEQLLAPESEETVEHKKKLELKEKELTQKKEERREQEEELFLSKILRADLYKVVVKTSLEAEAKLKKTNKKSAINVKEFNQLINEVKELCKEYTTTQNIVNNLIVENNNACKKKQRLLGLLNSLGDKRVSQGDSKSNISGANANIGDNKYA